MLSWTVLLMRMMRWTMVVVVCWVLSWMVLTMMTWALGTSSWIRVRLMGLGTDTDMVATSTTLTRLSSLSMAPEI